MTSWSKVTEVISLRYKKANGAKRKAENERIERKVPDMFKRDESPKQNGEDF